MTITPVRSFGGTSRINNKSTQRIGLPDRVELDHRQVSAWQRLSHPSGNFLGRSNPFASVAGPMMMAGCDSFSEPALLGALAVSCLVFLGWQLFKLRRATFGAKGAFKVLKSTVLPFPQTLAMEGVSTARWQSYVDTALVRFAGGGSMERSRRYAAKHGVDFDAFREGGLELKKDGSQLVGNDVFSMLIDREGFNVAGLYLGWEMSARGLEDSELDAMLDGVRAGHDMGRRMAARGAFAWEIEAVSRENRRFGFTDLLKRIAEDRNYFQMLDGIAIPTFLAAYYDKENEHNLAKKVRGSFLLDGNQAARFLRKNDLSSYIRKNGDPIEAHIVEALLKLQSARIHLWWVYNTDERYQYSSSDGRAAFRDVVDERMKLLTLVFEHLSHARRVMDNPSVIGDDMWRSEPLTAVRGRVQALWDEAASVWKRDCPRIDGDDVGGGSGGRVDIDI